MLLMVTSILAKYVLVFSNFVINYHKRRKLLSWNKWFSYQGDLENRKRPWIMETNRTLLVIHIHQPGWQGIWKFQKRLLKSPTTIIIINIINDDLITASLRMFERVQKNLSIQLIWVLAVTALKMFCGERQIFLCIILCHL